MEKMLVIYTKKNVLNQSLYIHFAGVKQYYYPWIRQLFSGFRHNRRVSKCKDFVSVISCVENEQWKYKMTFNWNRKQISNIDGEVQLTQLRNKFWYIINESYFENIFLFEE